MDCKFTEEEINNILGLKNQKDGSTVDVFNLKASLLLFNSHSDDLFNRYSSHSLPIKLDDFWDCETEDQVRDTFSDLLKGLVEDCLF